MSDKKDVIVVKVTCGDCAYQRDNYCYGRLCKGKPVYVRPFDYCSFGKEESKDC